MAKKWIPDGWNSSVVVHDVGEPPESVTLVAGDLIPDGVELGAHIPTTTTKPKSQRLREAEAEYEGETGGEDPGAGAGTGPTPDFDPGQHTVADVTRYLQEHPEDAARVFELEESGQRRAGILGKQV